MMQYLHKDSEKISDKPKITKIKKSIQVDFVDDLSCIAWIYFIVRKVLDF